MASTRGNEEAQNLGMRNWKKPTQPSFHATLIEKTLEKSAAILLSDAAPVNRIHGVVEPTHIVLVVIPPNQT